MRNAHPREESRHFLSRTFEIQHKEELARFWPCLVGVPSTFMLMEQSRGILGRLMSAKPRNVSRGCGQVRFLSVPRLLDEMECCRYAPCQTVLFVYAKGDALRASLMLTAGWLDVLLTELRIHGRR